MTFANHFGYPAFPISVRAPAIITRVILLVLPVTACGLFSATFGQDPQSEVVAMVAGHEVTDRQVDALLNRVLDDRPLDDAVRSLLWAKALEQTVGQLLVNEYLAAQGLLASDEEVQRRIQQVEAELRSIEHPIDDFLASQGLTKSGWSDQIRFQLSWPRYLDQMLTEENVRKHFEKYRRELDGSEVRVSHLLIKPEPDDANGETARRGVDDIRQKIEGGEIDWGAAVEQFSQAATRESGGDLGWIQRSVPMPEAFSAAAFGLEPEQVSPPVRTEFGWHLIRCEEWRPGTKSLDEIQPEVRRHATQFLFRWVSDKQRPITPPEFLGSRPRIDPETGELVSGNAEESSAIR